MERKVKFFIVYFVGFGAFFGYGILTHEDTAIARMQTWSSSTPYKVVLSYPKTLPVQQQGRLGAFYSCMLNYGGVGKRHPTISPNNINEQLQIELGDHTKIEFGVNATEAYTFNFELYDSKGQYLDASNLYVINCDIRLLDKPDSDMHCERRLLGNYIRPVCTYSPNQSGQERQQDSASSTKNRSSGD